MEKTVKKGLRDCTVNLDGSECTVKFDSCFRAFSVRNDSASDVFISKTSGIVPDNDGVMCVKSGASAVFAHNDLDKNTVFLLGSGKVQIHGQQDSNNPFNFAPTYDGGVKASGNPVIMDGLQGGVPFSEMVVKGKNLLPRKSFTSIETNGITFILNNDGSITAKGASTANIFFDFTGTFSIPDGIYCLSGTPSEYLNDNCYMSIRSNTPPIGEKTNFDELNGSMSVISHDDVYCIIRINSGVDFGDGVTLYPQLEIGSTPTAYEPPITGRDLTVGVCGKNLFDYRISAVPTGITVTTLDDGSLKVSGKMERESAWGINLIAKSLLPKGETYTLSINPDVIGILPISVYYIGSAKEKQTFIWNRDDYFTVSFSIQPNVDYDFVFRPQLEIGSTRNTQLTLRNADNVQSVLLSYVIRDNVGI